MTANAHSTDFSLAQTQPFHDYDYGFDVGGPILKDQLVVLRGLQPSSQLSQGTTKRALAIPTHEHLDGQGLNPRTSTTT